MNKELNHIYWFAPINLTNPSSRYRGKYPVDYFSQKTNVSSGFIFPERSLRGILMFLKIFLSALLFRKPNSLILVQKVYTNGWYAKLLKLLVFCRKSNTIYDIDDAEYIRNPTGTIHYFLNKCEKITVGSQKLMDYCKEFNANVFINTSPVTTHDVRKVHKNKVLNIGWAGDIGNGNKISLDFTHKRGLFELVFSQLKEINFPLKLTLIGVHNEEYRKEIKVFFKNKPSLEIDIFEPMDWKNDDWLYSAIKEFDVGIYPMVDHPFNQAKSAFKAKQYLSCGVPSIVSDIGENSKYVRHGVNGFICETGKDFGKAIIKYINMSDKEYMKESENCLLDSHLYSMENYCSTLLQIYSLPV